MSADHYPLPSYKHLPGINQRPQDQLLHAIASQASPRTENATAHENLAWCYGVRLLNEGYYWESHEVLEAVWSLATPNSRERFLLQGLIHIANAALKTNLQKPRAAERLSKLAVVCIARAYAHTTDTLMGIDGACLRDIAENCATEGFYIKIK